MASNDGQRLRIFGLSFREHDNRKMQQILGHYNQLPRDPGDRESLFVQLARLGRQMNIDDNAQDDIHKLTYWLKSGGDFPLSMASPPRSQRSGHGVPAAPHPNNSSYYSPYFHSRGHRLDAEEDVDMTADESLDAPTNPPPTRNQYGTHLPHGVSPYARPNYNYSPAFLSRGRRLDSAASDEDDVMSNPADNTFPSAPLNRHHPMPFHQAPAGMPFPQPNQLDDREAPTSSIAAQPKPRIIGQPVEAQHQDNTNMVDINDYARPVPGRTVTADGNEWEPSEDVMAEFEEPFVPNHARRDYSSHEEMDDEVVLRADKPTQVTNVDDNHASISDNSSTKVADLECSVCLESYPHSKFPKDRVTDSCAHIDLACLPCLNYSIEVTLGRGALNELACPNCPEKLSHTNIKDYATPENFARYDYLKMRASMPSTFIMCLAPGCGCGQEHEGGEGEPMMICHHCKFKTCVKHKLPWHEGQSCEQFDLDEKQLDRLEEEEASAKLLSSIKARICPNCSQGVEKQAGCDHMRCRCGQEWCYICMCSWENILRIGRTAHAPTCTYHPNKVNVRRNQEDAQQQRMMDLLHGGEVSDALAKARDELRKKRREIMRPLAAAAAEHRLKKAQENMTSSSEESSRIQTPRKKVKLFPAWEEGGSAKKAFS